MINNTLHTHKKVLEITVKDTSYMCFISMYDKTHYNKKKKKKDTSHDENGLPWWFSSKESACQCRRCRRPRFDSRVGKIPCRREWQPTPVFLPG